MQRRDLQVPINVRSDFREMFGSKTNTSDEVRSDFHEMSGSMTNASDEVSKSLDEKLKKQDAMKNNLIKLYELAHSLFDSETVLEGVKDMMTEAKVDYPGRIKANHGKLLAEDCPIVITGETSSGKSCMINLLIGEEILPYSVLHKTAAICCLHHSANKRLVYDESGRKRERDLKNILAEDLSKELDEMMKDTTIKLIDIYWPIPLLENQEKVTLVDTPGLGDNEEMVQILLRYLPNAVGFIYVLNSANAGGIEENKILRILREQMKLEGNGENVFDISTAIFVCNKWDQVSANEDEQVMKYIQTKLEKCMELANKTIDMDKQVLRFSVIQAKSKMRATDASFAVLLKSIKDLVSTSLERKYIQLYRWLRHSLLENMYETAATHLRHTWTPFEERHKLHANIEKRLDGLHKKCKKVYDQMEKEGKTFYKSIAEKLHKYLKTEAVQQRLRTWTDDQTPSPRDTPLAETIEKAIMERITKEIRLWYTNDTNFKNELRAFQSNCSELSKSIRNDIEQVQLSIEGAGRISDLPIRPKKQDDGLFDMLFEDVNTAGKVAAAVTTPLWLPLFFVIGALGIPVMGIGSLVKGIAKDAKYAVDNRALAKEYKKGQADFMSKRSIYVLKEQITAAYLEAYIRNTYYTEYISRVETWYKVSIPKQIEANKNLLENIRTEGDSSKQVREKYKPMQSLLQNILSGLISFRFRFLEEPYINKADIEPKGSVSTGNVKKVEYHLGQSRQILAMKTVYSQDNIRLHQIESLRTLKHTNIVETVGVMLDRGAEIQNAGVKINVLMELCEETAENLFFHGRSCSTFDLKTEEGKDALRLFTEVGSGSCRALKYMHEKGVLHGNLKLGKILISNHQAKLIGMGSVKYECAVTERDMTGLSHFAPELFIGKPYYISADVYSLGIALWEMWFGRRAFSETELQTSTPRDFSTKLAVRNLLDTKGETTPSDKLWKQMQSCLAYEFDKRPKIEQVLTALTEISR